MNIKFQENFTRQFNRLSKTQKQVVTDAIELFAENPTHESLRNHPLRNEWANYRSITADDDLRLHYRVLNKDTALFVAIGTHKELYK